MLAVFTGARQLMPTVRAKVLVETMIGFAMKKRVCLDRARDSRWARDFRFLWIFAVGAALAANATADVPVTNANVATSEADATMKVVFEEDFENGMDRWEVLDPDTWKMSAKDGNHHLGITKRESDYKPPHRSPRHIALIRDLELSSFDITFRVRSTFDSGNHRDCCVFFAYQDNKHFYYVHMGAKPDPASGQIMIVKDAPRSPMTDNEVGVPWTDEWHKVRLSRDATTGKVDVYFDDLETPWLSVSDTTFAKGRIGLGSFDDMNEFDDIVVRERKADSE